MRQLIVLSKNAFKLCMRNKFVVTSMIVFPVLSTFLILLGSTNGSTMAKTNVGYYSAVNNVYSSTIIDNLNSNSLFSLYGKKDLNDASLGINLTDSSDLPAQFKKIAYAANINIFIYIPKDIESRIKSGATDAVIVYDTGNDQKSQVLQSALSQILSRLKTFSDISNGDETTLKDMLSHAQAGNLKGATVAAGSKSDTQSSDKGQKFSLVMGFFSWFAIWGSSFAITMIMKERGFKVFKRIMLTNAGVARYLSSKFIVGAAIGIIQVALMLISFKYVIRADYLVHWWQLGLLLFGFILIAITINLAIVSFCSSESQITYASIIIVNITAMFSGGYWSLELMPQWMKNLSYFTPQRWITYTISKICTNHAYAMLEYWLVVLGFMAFFSSVAMLGFKYRSKLDA
jgi:ABC-type multidrug transport system permease subunit